MRVRLDNCKNHNSNTTTTSTSSNPSDPAIAGGSTNCGSSGDNPSNGATTKNKPPRPYSFRALTSSGGSATAAPSSSIKAGIIGGVVGTKKASATATTAAANCSSAHSTATGEFSMSESDEDAFLRSVSMGLPEDDFDNDLVAVDDRRKPLPRFENGDGEDVDSSVHRPHDGSTTFAATNSEDHVGQHPALQAMCVMNTATNTRIIPNGRPAVLENECFYGRVMLLVRTPEVDEPDDGADATMGEIPRAASEYFRGKKRRFEFQFQIKLKKVPTGALFLGCELEHMIRVGTITKGLVGILLAMVRRINPGFHYSWGDQDTVSDADRAAGNYEKTHLSFPVEASMDRIVITKPGETPPTLGEELNETLESVKRRRKMGVGSVDWNTEDVFTMCLWSAYADWIKWKSLNVPGVTPFSLSRVTGTQPIYLSVYEIRSCAAVDYRKKRPPHKRQDLLVYTRLEFTNVTATRGGLAERVLGRSNKALMLPTAHDNMSLPDTESVDSDFETTSRVTCS
jgi:Protein of unknown function (DUF1769)